MSIDPIAICDHDNVMHQEGMRDQPLRENGNRQSYHKETAKATAVVGYTAMNSLITQSLV